MDKIKCLSKQVNYNDLNYNFKNKNLPKKFIVS